MQLPRLRKKIPRQRQTEKAHSRPYWGETLQMRSLQQAIFTRLQPENAHENSYRREAIYMPLPKLQQAPQHSLA